MDFPIDLSDKQKINKQTKTILLKVVCNLPDYTPVYAFLLRKLLHPIPHLNLMTQKTAGGIFNYFYETWLQKLSFSFHKKDKKVTKFGRNGNCSKKPKKSY